MSIADNIALIRARIEAAARRAERDPQEIILMGVTKTVEPHRIREAYQAGVRVFGENRVQEFAAKRESLRDLSDVEWHMIGHLQANKGSRAAALFAAIDSLDSLRLAQRLNSAVAGLGKKLAVTIEINIAGEAAKSGMHPDAGELERLLSVAPELPGLEFCGLMTVPPYNDDPEQSRPYFRKMRSLFDQVAERKLPQVHMRVLSMGMSDDFEIAIEERATCVRIGRAIFGQRPPARSKH
jgi:PLP dependent protein